MTTHLDAATWATLIVTLILFAVALVVKGFGHDLLLEAGVFLVSVKLVVMTYKASVSAEKLGAHLEALRSGLDRIEQTLRDGSDSGGVHSSR
jgi:hypothetical protein